MKSNLRLINLVIIFVLALTVDVKAIGLIKASKDATDQLKINGLEDRAGWMIVVSVFSYHSGKTDTTSRKIKNELQLAFQEKFKKSKVTILKESLVGVGNKSYHVKGTYQQSGDYVTLRLKALEGSMTGRVIAQSKVFYRLEKQTHNDLMVVLDIESDQLKLKQKKVFSDLFRVSLIQRGFDLLSSSEVEKAGADDIQKETGCSRSECATIIGQQFGTDKSMSVTYTKVSSKNWYLIAEILDIKKGKVDKIEKVRHDGNIDTLEEAIDTLAAQLSGIKVQQKKTVESGTSTSQNLTKEKTTRPPRKKNKLYYMYINNRDGTVTVHNGDLMWQLQDDNRKRKWVESKLYCQTLTLGGNQDWRLPSQKELRLLLRALKYSKEKCTYFTSLLYSSCWTTRSYNSSLAWFLDFYSRYANSDDKNEKSYVRCVRSEKK